MPVRKTESRIPANFQASDLGQAVLAADGRCALISFVTSPMVDRENIYVFFVTNGALAQTVQSFEWKFEENRGTTKIQSTERSEITYQPQTTETLNIAVRILEARNKAGPGFSILDMFSELVKEHNCYRYYQGLKIQAPETDDVFAHFMFSMVCFFRFGVTSAALFHLGRLRFLAETRA